MFEYIEKLKLLDIIHGVSSVHHIHTDIPSNTLVFKMEGESKYTFTDQIIHLVPGDVLFIPQGTSYEVKSVFKETGHFVSINFRAELGNAFPKKFSLSHQLDFHHLCMRVCKHRVSDTPSDRYRFLGLFYEILSYLSENEKATYQMPATLCKLDSAVEYLKEALFDPALRIDQLHRLCGISDTYFRKLFVARFGVSPKRYVLNKRLTHAKKLLDHGEFNSISEVALLSGFHDALYFGKVFNDKYGCCPSDYIAGIDS